jgi:hypothetical protein
MKKIAWSVCVFLSVAAMCASGLADGTIHTFRGSSRGYVQVSRQPQLPQPTCPCHGCYEQTQVVGWPYAAAVFEFGAVTYNRWLVYWRGQP